MIHTWGRPKGIKVTARDDQIKDIQQISGNANREASSLKETKCDLYNCRDRLPEMYQ